MVPGPDPTVSSTVAHLVGTMSAARAARITSTVTVVLAVGTTPMGGMIAAG
ncbi:hypothetical protein FHT00_003073 [Sphingomonas insulae]|uniref:Uncharacterized protein n=1 Tax=Sphingomonas insulae TaxID=424800 RepID=A0ABN1HZH0_9SPHN|nr:hypothetical protein [Sphingomonas insulae]